MKPTNLDPAVSRHLSTIGRKGGSATGAAKRRGGPEYYRAIAKKAVAARLAKKGAKA